jgi:hypothetical protein
LILLHHHSLIGGHDPLTYSQLQQQSTFSTFLSKYSSGQNLKA